MKILIVIFLINFCYFSDLKSRNVVFQNTIKGCFCEGGIIIGLVEKNDIVKIDGIQQSILDENYFVYAFGRKYKNTVEIRVNDASKVFKVMKKKYKIERINGLPQNKVEPNKEQIEKIVREQSFFIQMKKNTKTKRLFKKSFTMPINGRLTGIFGSQRILNKKPKRPHYGIDLAAKIGTKIKAPANGIVKGVYKEMFFTGNTLVIDHGLGLISILAHMDEIFVKEGEIIDFKSILGTVGKTGRATGPHLHWGVYLEKTPIDPMVLINYDFSLF